jgi:hypothetical protein
MSRPFHDRADQIERMQDENGQPIDPELFKVISPKIFILNDGNWVGPGSQTALH